MFKRPNRSCIMKGFEKVHPMFSDIKVTRIGQCEHCGRIGEVVEYGFYWSPLIAGKTVFCAACHGCHLEAPLFY